MQYGFKKNFIILAVITFLLFSIAFWFLHQQIEKKSVSYEKISTEWQAEDTRRNEIKTILRTADSIQMNNVIISSHFVSSSNLVPFLDTLDNLAPKVGAENEIVSVDISPDTKKLVVSSRVMGSFESIYKFLMLLENSPYEIKFLATDVHKVTGKQKGETVGVKSEKTGKVYSWEGSFKIELLSFIP
jgi:hypothetical protein